MEEIFDIFSEIKVIDIPNIYSPRNRKEVSSFLEVEKSKFPVYDPYYVMNGVCKDRRKKFNKLYSKFSQFADSNFLSEIKTNFHEKSWEMYLGNVLLKHGETLVNSRTKKCPGGPDLNIDDSIYIECICSDRGTGEDALPKMELGFHDWPRKELVLRITNSFMKKVKHYNRWIKNSCTGQDAKNCPYIIAINTAELEHIQTLYELPLVVTPLFGFGDMQINMASGKRSFSQMDDIVKKSGKPVSMGLFESDAFKEVSGVIFSENFVINNLESIGKDCYFINNPFATNKISKERFSYMKVCWAEVDKSGVTINKLSNF